MDRREYSFLSIPLNLKFSFPPKLGGMGGNEIRFITIKPGRSDRWPSALTGPGDQLDQKNMWLGQN